MSWQTFRYDGQLDYSAFSCDEPILNEYLHNRAADEHSRDLCILYFLIADDGAIGGFYSITNGSISRDKQLKTAKERKNLPYRNLGTVHIGRLARNKDLVGKQLGQHVMHSALSSSVEASKTSGAWAVTVDAKNEKVENYYSKFGFIPLKQDPANPPYPKPMYLRMKDARLIISPT